MTLDLGGCRFPDRLDELVDRFDDAVGAPGRPSVTARWITGEGDAAGRGPVPGA